MRAELIYPELGRGLRPDHAENEQQPQVVLLPGYQMLIVTMVKTGCVKPCASNDHSPYRCQTYYEDLGWQVSH